MSENKLPAFQFYPGDWLHDTALRACSIKARGLWIEMMCLMHQAEPYGHLTIAGEAMDIHTLCRVLATDLRQTYNSILELERRQVFSRTADGVIYSRRMVKDAYLRSIRAKAGSLGGKKSAAILLKQTLKQNEQQKATPSSSSSSSLPPLPPQSGGSASLEKKEGGINPRAAGTNPRAKAKKELAAIEAEKTRKKIDPPSNPDDILDYDFIVEAKKNPIVLALQPESKK